MDVVLAGAQAGAQYALLAVAIVVVFSTTRVVNFAVAAFGVVAVYVALTLSRGGIPGAIAIVLGCLAAGLCAGVMERVVATPLLNRLPKDGPGVVIIASLLVLELGRTGTNLIFGATPKAWPAALSVDGAVDFAGSVLTHAAIITYIVTAVVMACSYWLVYRTTMGTIVRAVAERPKTMGLVGVEASRVRFASWVVAGVLAGVAGILLANSITPTPGMTLHPLIGALAGVALGGLTSILGAAAGAFLIGMAQTMAAAWLTEIAVTALPVALILVVLLLRPQGLFGRAEAVRP
jgi:branched-chain amino acid transport system permease protein